LGSTVTAALIIGDVATIANVGDSRTYLLRDGRLERITQDHSLVARLVDAGVITPEEVRTHPQRNQIYRCLGHKPELDVDTFTVQLQAGDRLVLCSDGLWEMVLDENIQHAVEKARTPQKACDVLIEEANRAGGEDNISVIVVELE
jgi:protein phosphatase